MQLQPHVHEYDHDDIDTRSRQSDDLETPFDIIHNGDDDEMHNSKYQVKLIKQKSLWYWIFNKVLRLNKTSSAKYSNMLLDHGLVRYLTITLCLLEIATFIPAIYLNSSIGLAILICLTIGTTVALLDVNKNYFLFKKFSTALLWKLYNFIACSIAIWIINVQRHQTNAFRDLGTNETQSHSNVYSAVYLLFWMIIGTLGSLHPGLFWNKKVKFATVPILSLFLIYRSVYYYFSDSDATITILSQRVSMKTQIISRSLDLAL